MTPDEKGAPTIWEVLRNESVERKEDVVELRKETAKLRDRMNMLEVKVSAAAAVGALLATILMKII